VTGRVVTAGFLALIGAAFLAHNRAVARGGIAVLTADEVRNFADSVLRLPRIKVPDGAAMIVRIAWIESRFDTSAVRSEPRINDASIGLMQTLLGTARWLYDDLGFRHFARPTVPNLMGPQASIYYGAAYLTYLSIYAGRARSAEFVVRSYNGGPGNLSAATADYWRKYLAAKERFG